MRTSYLASPGQSGQSLESNSLKGNQSEQSTKGNTKELTEEKKTGLSDTQEIVPLCRPDTTYCCGEQLCCHKQGKHEFKNFSAHGKIETLTGPEDSQAVGGSSENMNNCFSSNALELTVGVNPSQKTIECQ